MSLLFRCMRTKQILFRNTPRCLSASNMQIRVSSTTPPPPKPNDTNNEDKSVPKYEVKFVQTDVKKVFKEFYSLYGPLFVGCHIGVSLTSLGFFCSLIYLSVDLKDILPDFLIEAIGRRMAEMTGEGGKFVVAYAIHKIILPVRLGAAIYLTKLLSKRIKLGKK